MLPPFKVKLPVLFCKKMPSPSPSSSGMRSLSASVSPIVRVVSSMLTLAMVTAALESSIRMP